MRPKRRQGNVGRSATSLKKARPAREGLLVWSDVAQSIHGRVELNFARHPNTRGRISMMSPMYKYQPSKMLRLFLTEGNRYNGKPLYEAIVDKCREMGIAGATVFRGIKGYGHTGEIHHSHLVKHHLPILITIVDSSENLDRLVPALEPMIDQGLIATSDVTAIRVNKSVGSRGV
jgi:uncharacterized protein